MDTPLSHFSWAAKRLASGGPLSSSVLATNGRSCTFMDQPLPTSRDRVIGWAARQHGFLAAATAPPGSPGPAPGHMRTTGSDEFLDRVRTND